ncbi:MAG TPA: hypothetical protein VLX44_16600 [Xanthobacteraceae bacterium]|nr:hypothetical protein [Xanthobacteraceae bacterium]
MHRKTLGCAANSGLNDAARATKAGSSTTRRKQKQRQACNTRRFRLVSPLRGRRPLARTPPLHLSADDSKSAVAVAASAVSPAHASARRTHRAATTDRSARADRADVARTEAGMGRLRVGGEIVRRTHRVSAVAEDRVTCAATGERMLLAHPAERVVFARATEFVVLAASDEHVVTMPMPDRVMMAVVPAAKPDSRSRNSRSRAHSSRSSRSPGHNTRMTAPRHPGGEHRRSGLVGPSRLI